MQLRPYQEEAAVAIQANLAEHGSTLCVMATGLGKTVVLSDIVRRCPGRAILFTHREELLWQGRNKLQAMMPYEHIDIEMAEFSASLKGGSLPKCVVASVQSMHAKRLPKYNPDLFDLLIFDECHHLRVKSNTIYGRILEHFSKNPRIKMLGVTATPDRHDGKSLGSIFKSVAYDYSLPKAIADGYLVPIKQNMVTITSLDLTAVSTYMGDLAAGSLDEVMSTERNLLGVAYPTLELTGDRKTLIFTAGVHQAHRLAEILNREKPASAHAIDGGMASGYRRELVEAYNAGAFQYLVNCNIATEGFDSPAIQCVVMARPTKSRPLYCFDGATEILTQRGWVPGLNLSHDDYVAAYNTDNGNITWEEPAARVVRNGYQDEKFIELQTPQVDFRVTCNHRMVTRTRTGRHKARTPWVFREAGDLTEIPDLFEMPVAGIEHSDGLPLTDHELQFIGWFLTDGCRNKHNNCITISQDINQPWNEKIEECLVGCGFKYSKDTVTRTTKFKDKSTIHVYRISKGKPRGSGKHLRGWGHLEPYLDKDLPKTLEAATPHQLGQILLAMHYGDGQKFTKQPWTQRSYHISTGRAVLAGRLQSLCVRRGFACNIAIGEWNKNPIYILHIRNKAVRSLRFSPDRNYEPVFTAVGTELVWCVEVSTGAVIVRRNGKVLVSGNCQMLGRGTRILPNVIEGADSNGLDYQLTSPEERRAAIQGSGKPHLLVIDFTGNSGKHRLVHPADVLGGTVESPLSDELSELIDAKVTKATANKEAADVSQVMEEARLELEAKKRLAELQEQERVAKLREVVRASVQYTIKNINPMDVFSLPDAPKGNIGMDFAKRPTEMQVKSLREFGVDVHHDQGEWWIGPPKIKAQWQKITQGAAGKLLNTLKERRKQDLCSYKQAMLLARFGENPHCTFKDAKAIIDEIAANDWKPRKKTIDELSAEQLKVGAENVKYKWVERRTLSMEAVSWTHGQMTLAGSPEKKRYYENCLKLNQVPRGCPVENPIQVAQERVAIEVKLPAIKTPPKPKIQQAIDF